MTYRMSKKLLRYNLIGMVAITLITFGLGAIIAIPGAIYYLVTYFKSSLEVSAKSVILRRGWISTTQTEIPFSKINSVSVAQGPISRLFGAGNVAILAGNDLKGEIFMGIDNPMEVRQAIMKHVRQ